MIPSALEPVNLYRLILGVPVAGVGNRLINMSATSAVSALSAPSAISSVVGEGRACVIEERWGHFDREVRKSPSLAYTRSLGSHVLLSPGQAEVVLVPLDAGPAATYQRDWRAVFYWRREDLKTRFDIWADSSLWLPAWLRGRGVRVHGAPSEWMDQ